MRNQSGIALRMKRYSENCWPSTPPPLDAAMLKLAFNRRVIAYSKYLNHFFLNNSKSHFSFVPASNSICSNRWEGTGWRAEGLDSKPRWIGHPSEALRFPERFLPPNSGLRITWFSLLNLDWRKEPNIPNLIDCCNLLRMNRNLRQSNPSGTSNLRLQNLHRHFHRRLRCCYCLRQVNFVDDPSGYWMKRLNVTDRHQSRSCRQTRANNGIPKPDWNSTLLDDRCAGNYCASIYHLDRRNV